MYALDYSINNMTLLALRVGQIRGRRCHRDAGKHHPPYRTRHAALRGGAEGRAEIGFTIISITFSLIAVFIPVL
jgi:multidrug efflux pump subunit AcrB